MLDGTELEILKWVRGPLYRRRRDAVLAATADMTAVVEGSRLQPDRRVEIVATILGGWKAHGARYEGLFRELGKADVAGAAAKITGVGGVVAAMARSAEEGLGEAVLPLCWEQILKFSDELPAWQLETMFLTIRRVPSEASIEPLLWFIEQSSDPGQIDSAHQALLAQPFEGQKARFVQMREALSLRAFVADDILARLKAAKKP